MEIKLNLTQIDNMRHTLKKGFWAAYSRTSDMDELVKMGLMTVSDGPFKDFVYRLTNKGFQYANSINNA